MIHFIVFSRNRPLQLDGYLRSLRKRVRGSAAVDVLVKTDPPYTDSYSKLAQTFSDVRFFDQDDFSRDMYSLIKLPSEYICFGCDDVIFRRTVAQEDVDYLMSDPRVIGVSLRLGQNVTHGMFQNEQPQPVFERNHSGRSLTWDMNEAVGDWCYPWDVLGTIYRYGFVQSMWPSLAMAQNPSQFEDAGSRSWRQITGQHHYACWQTARTTVPTPNVVQREFGNGFVGNSELDPEFLLACFEHGMRMDLDRFDTDYNTWRIADFHMSRVIE